MNKWQQWYEDTPGGKYARKVGDGRFHIIEWINFHEHCGYDGDKYHIELSEVDVIAIGTKMIRDAIESCGWENMPDTEEAIAEVLHSYGAKAHLFNDSGNNLNKLMRAARKASKKFTDDSEELEAAMNKPVNAIGSTAREMMNGDIYSAMDRGVRAGNTNAKIMAKMHGFPDELIEAAKGMPSVPGFSMDVDFNKVSKEFKTTDPLPIIYGYGQAMAGYGMQHDRKELSEGYIKGYQLGADVRAGHKPKPNWA